MQTCSIRRHRQATLINFNELKPQGGLGGSILSSRYVSWHRSIEFTWITEFWRVAISSKRKEDDLRRSRNSLDRGCVPLGVVNVYSTLTRTRTRGTNGRPLARALDRGLREENPARRRHPRRGRGEVTPQRSGLSARLRGSGPRRREPPPPLRGGGGGPPRGGGMVVACRCTKEEEGERARARTKRERRARSRECESWTDGINCVLSLSLFVSF